MVNDPRRPTDLEAILKRTYRGKRVLISGHNGFVGSWLSFWMATAGAEVLGISLPPEPGCAAELIGLDEFVTEVELDIRDQSAFSEAVRQFAPEIVFHLAAQALVLPSFDDPVGTFATNVMGTAHLLDAMRGLPSVTACVIVTSDKCYAVADHAHEERDPLGGEDPYSASKAGAEIVAHAFRSTFFSQTGARIATARAGNIVGGGDWAPFRIVPDCIRAMVAGESVRLRQPTAVRPWQHVLDAVAGYLRLGDALITQGHAVAEGWNFGPSPEAAVTVVELVERVMVNWQSLGGEVRPSEIDETEAAPERAYLTLVSTKAHRRLGWSPLLDFDNTIAWTVEWYYAAQRPSDALASTRAQIGRYLELDAEANRSHVEFDAQPMPLPAGSRRDHS
jgi:CDP-glucose 4,6-dehydratase